jgi:uncharacterized protein (TIGR03000 family)
LVVQLPADAKLYVDDQLTKTEGQAERTFSTPSLERGRDYYYILKAEVVRDGQTTSDSRRVIVRAGEEARASFGDMAAVANDSRTVTQK